MWTALPQGLERRGMFKDSAGPIEQFDWATFTIRGETHSADGEGVGKDICILKGAVKPWKARKGHRLEPDMLDCIRGAGVRVLVIGNGVHGALEVPDQVRNAVRAEGIETLIVEKTPDACAIYNRYYREGKDVAFLAHGTC